MLAQPKIPVTSSVPCDYGCMQVKIQTKNSVSYIIVSDLQDVSNNNG
jgi:hypothetical protein